ncbi:MAG: queE [Bacteriovoracaceae bacterium]|nr:queE [Bacteriovoracaceae bacterium]
MTEKNYLINEWFYSLQGEGIRSGTPNLFLRFSACNLSCSKETEGFDCDTEFVSGKKWTLDEIVKNLKDCSPDVNWIILTGGEPTLQLDDEIIDRLHREGYKLAIETNGTKAVSPKIDWITVSPKTAEHAVQQKTANEVKYVRSFGMGIPKTSIEAQHYLISPAFEGDTVPQKNIDWCIQLVKENPSWRLSLQTHKLLRIR